LKKKSCAWIKQSSVIRVGIVKKGAFSASTQKGQERRGLCAQRLNGKMEFDGRLKQKKNVSKEGKTRQIKKVTEKRKKSGRDVTGTAAREPAGAKNGIGRRSLAP